MRRLIQRQIDNVCSIYSSYRKLGLLTWPRNLVEAKEFDTYGPEIFSAENNFNSVLTLPNHVLARNLIILDIDNVILLYDQIISNGNGNLYQINNSIIKLIQQFDASDTILVIATNHIAEDVRPIFKRSIDFLFERVTIKPSFIISNIGHTGPDYKSYILMLFISKLILAKIISVDTKIYQYDNEIVQILNVVHSFEDTISQDAMQHISAYHNVTQKILQAGFKVYSSASMFYVNYVNGEIIDFLTQANTSSSFVTMANKFNNLMLFHFPCYLLLSCN